MLPIYDVLLGGKASQAGSLCLIFLVNLYANNAYADSITTTGRTETTVSRDGNVVDITTTSIHGSNALNEFGRFNVASGETVNLFVPDQAQNLLNLLSLIHI